MRITATYPVSVSIEVPDYDEEAVTVVLSKLSLPMVEEMLENEVYSRLEHADYDVDPVAGWGPAHFDALEPESA